MHFNEFTLSKQLKKKALNKKNRYHQQIFEIMRMRRAESARARDQERAKPGRDAKKNDPAAWSDKVSKVRNRLTGKKRDSKERWNRFAGTSDAGGRGL